MKTEEIKEFDKNNNLIHSKNSSGYEVWQEFDENNNLIYFRNSDGEEYWYKYDEYNKRIEITKKEFGQIKRKKDRELINNSKISRFELLDI